MTDGFPLEDEMLRFWRARSDYLGVLGRLHGARGETARATDCLTRRAALAHHLRDAGRQLDALAGLSDVAIAAGRPGDSLWALQRAAPLASDAGVDELAAALGRALPAWAGALPAREVLGALGAILGDAPSGALRAALAGALRALGDPARAAELESPPPSEVEAR